MVLEVPKMIVLWNFRN